MEDKGKWRSVFEKHINGGSAFMPVEQVLEKMEFSKLGIRPAGLPYSFYELFYHMWFTQKDILKYCHEKDYEAPGWPTRLLAAQERAC